LIIFLVLGGLTLVCCCGGVVYFGMALVTEEVADQLRYHPVVLEHVGEVEEFQINWAKSINEDDNVDLWFYNVKGTKGRGVIACEHITNENGDEEIVSAELKLPDGRKFDLTQDAQ
jgi:hypothetical protein